MSFDSPALREPEIETGAIDAVVEQTRRHGEEFRRQAIRETDWSETAVLRIIERTPEVMTAFDPGNLNTCRLPRPQLEAERYSRRAPPVSAHGDDRHRCHVQTITKPLLDRLSEEHPGVSAFMDEVEG